METYNNGYPKPQDSNSLVDIHETLDFLWRLRWIILASVALSLVVAFAYLRMQNAEYQRSTWVKLNGNDGSDLNVDLMKSISGTQYAKRVDNEATIIKSPSIMSHVVENLGLNHRYYHYSLPIADRIRTGRGFFDFKREEYYHNNPFEFIESADSLYGQEFWPKSVSLTFRNIDGKTFNVEHLVVNGREMDDIKKKSVFQYGKTYPIPGGHFQLRVKYPEQMLNGDRYMATLTSSWSEALSLCSRLSISTHPSFRRGDNTDIVVVTLTDNSAKRAEDVLNALILEVNAEGKDYSNMVAYQTLQFLNERLESLASSLDAAESDFRQYQSNNVVVDLNSQSQLAMSADMNYQNQLVEVSTQIKILDLISDYLTQIGDGSYKVIPSNIGISDGGLNSVIGNYNTLVAERNRLLSNASENNPRVVNLSAQLEEAKRSIEVSIGNLYKVYRIRESELSNTLSASKRKMSHLPSQQLHVQQLSRKVSVIEPLYLLLQQKREEAQIAMCSQVETFRVIEKAYGNSAPVSPTPMRIFIIAFLIGFCLPPGFVLFRTFVRTKVETKDDIKNILGLDVLGMLPLSKDVEGNLVAVKGHGPSSESFRMLRSNLQYMTTSKILQVTSSVPGEGKSFVASNLAVSLAHAGKKVLLVGMDLRKPVLRKIFNVEESGKRNLISYMLGKISRPEDAVTPIEKYPGLDIVHLGPVPPNPSELLSIGRQKELLDALAPNYDFVLIDSAPLLPVADSAIINKLVDATLLVVRSGYTELRILKELNDYITNESSAVKNPKVVLNGVDLTDRKYHYGYGRNYSYGYGYGSRHHYGYGYGYGYGYYGSDEKEAKDADKDTVDKKSGGKTGGGQA